MNKLLYVKWFVALLLFGVLLFLLFFAETSSFSSRSFRMAWNLGHIPLFIAFGYFVLRHFPVLKNKSLWQQFAAMIFLSCLVGGSIELLQDIVGRQASLQDVMLDVTGGIIAVLLFSGHIRQSTSWLKVISTLLSVLLVLFAARSFVVSFWDEYKAREEFPLLADFENEREIQRWSSIEKMEITDELARYGLKSLKLGLTRRLYSGLELNYFPPDWSGFNFISMHVYNPESTVVSLTVSIFDDKHHANKYAYSDRYTNRFQLFHGWNEVKVSLSEVKQAPRTRLMNMHSVRGLRLFVVRPQKIQHLYIDAIRLEE